VVFDGWIFRRIGCCGHGMCKDRVCLFDGWEKGSAKSLGGSDHVRERWTLAGPISEAREAKRSRSLVSRVT
jgi:hypothetical protein